MSLIDEKATRRARETGLAIVEAAERASWYDEFIAWFGDNDYPPGSLICPDQWKSDFFRDGGEKPHSCNVWGSIPRKLIRAALIEPTGETARARIKESHGHKFNQYVVL